jgi:sugar lactone lactonase YvrE
VHVTAQDMNIVQVWLEGSISPTRTLSGNLTAPSGVFATINGDVYVDNGNNYRIDKWTLNSNDSIYVTDIIWECTALFLDININIYCSIDVFHEVLKKSFVNGTNTSVVVAGNGTRGLASNLLASPNGIFVDVNFNLYIADWGNNRIQFYLPGQLYGMTVAGSGATGTITLYGPTDVVLDADNYLYIVDRSNSRIVGSGPSGYRCLVGCSGSSGSASNELNYPRSLSFDSNGNLFVTDTDNQRVQMFTLSTGLCSKFI